MNNPFAKKPPVALRELMEGLERVSGSALVQRVKAQLKTWRAAPRVAPWDAHTFGAGDVITFPSSSGVRVQLTGTSTIVSTTSWFR